MPNHKQDPLMVTVATRLSAGENRILVRLAQEADVSMSHLLRRLVRKAIKEGWTGTVPPSPRHPYDTPHPSETSPAVAS